MPAALRPNATEPGELLVGPTWSPGYLSDSTPFKLIFADLSLPSYTTTHVPNRKAMYLRFVESAVFSSTLSGGVLLEGPIVCGVGACGVCAVELRKGMRMLCSDGPVFDLRDLS